MVEILILGFACGFVSYTIARGSIFNGLRTFFFHRSEASPSPLETWKARKRKAAFFKFFEELLICPYCVSHWVALLMVNLWKVQPLISCQYPVLDTVLSIFLIVGVSSLSWGAFEKITS